MKTISIYDSLLVLGRGIGQEAQKVQAQMEKIMCQ